MIISSNQNTIGLNTLASGIYFITLSNSSKILKTQRIMLQ
ncbi:MAG: T9SS type A sorting domain-containing protein [Cytophagales bacterium]|nr:T9SS type A sorting domain-containing protein [Cytophagales bacterium]